MTKFFPDGLPQELKDTALWCVWRYERREGQDKPTKVPYNARTGGRAMSNSPSTFTSYQTAVKALERGGYDGLGVGVFNGLCAIDIDDCLDENGTPSPLALDIVSTMQSYTETSPSGRGVRIFFRADGFAYDRQRFFTMNAKQGLEIYVSGATSKFLTCTGHSDPWSGPSPLCERAEALQAILDRYMVRPKKTAPEAPKASQEPLALSDAEVLCEGPQRPQRGHIWRFVEGRYLRLWQSVRGGLGPRQLPGILDGMQCFTDGQALSIVRPDA